jgi:hypothetical protein
VESGNTLDVSDGNVIDHLRHDVNVCIRTPNLGIVQAAVTDYNNVATGLRKRLVAAGNTLVLPGLKFFCTNPLLAHTAGGAAGPVPAPGTAIVPVPHGDQIHNMRHDVHVCNRTTDPTLMQSLVNDYNDIAPLVTSELAAENNPTTVPTIDAECPAADPPPPPPGP